MLVDGRDRAHGPDDPEDPEQPAPPEPADLGNTGEQIDPAHLHERQLGGREEQVDEKIQQEDAADKIIDVPHHFPGFGIEVQQQVGHQRPERIKRKAEHQQFEVDDSAVLAGGVLEAEGHAAVSATAWV